ncbi:MAG: hypothetical protein ACRD8Z_23135 [Nitrososphaeraceae archaeon]
MSTKEDRNRIMTQSRQVLIEKLESLKKDEPYWSPSIDAILKDIDNDNIGPEGDTADLKLTILKGMADKVPQDPRGSSSSLKVKSLQSALLDYRNAFSNYKNHP